MAEERNCTYPSNLDRERGAVLVLTALVMMLLLFIAAFATDLGAWYRQGQEQQRAADVGALNGVQAYDRGVKEHWATFSPEKKRWSDLTLEQALDSEEAGLRMAANTIIALMETSGLSFSDAGTGALASDPRVADGGDSVWTVIADDGTEIRITRSFVHGTDSSGNPTLSRAIEVEVIAPGEQYFSNVVRDAPQIERSASSVLSNCGAECENTIHIPPPFAGFNASGNGDGFTPLLFNKDGNEFNGVEEIWAVNHHIDHVDGADSDGDIICMDAKTKQACLGGNQQFVLDTLYKDLQTANRPVDYIDKNTGIILFAARDAGIDKTGIACFDARDRSFCDTPFASMFDATTTPKKWGGWINITGPFVYGNKAYAFSQDGKWACREIDGTGITNTSCGGGNTPAADKGGMPDLTNRDFFISHGEQIGSKLYMRMPAGNDQRFFCMDLTNGSTCGGGWGGGDRLKILTDWGYHSDREITFTSYDSAGAPEGVCTVVMGGGNGESSCFSLYGGGNALGAVPNLQGLIQAMGGGWSGDAIAWEESGTNRVFTFFAGGNANKVGCYDWSEGDECDNAILETDFAFHGVPDKTNIDPYAFAQVTDECIIGLSHRSVFFSFNPANFSPCADTKVRAEIVPCECSDGSSNRWGEVRMPPELLAIAGTLEATVSASVGGPAVNNQLDGVDVSGAAGGVLDLSSIQDSDIVTYTTVDGRTVPVMYLTLNVDVHPSATFPPTGITADLQIVVQPTLTS